MNSKEIWTIAGIALIVSVLASVVTINASTSPALGPPVFGTNPNRLGPAAPTPPTVAINANACNLDGTCETNDIRSSGNVFVGNIQGDLSSEGNLVVENDLIVEGSFTQDCATIQYTSQSGSGDDACEQAGYDYCLAGDTYVDTVTYYSSTGGTCTGSIQLKVEEHRISTCPAGSGGGGSSACLQYTTGVSEPQLGDYKRGGSTSDGRILCCR